MREAREGDVVIEVTCCPAGPVLVLSTARETWKCNRCHSSGVTTGKATLGPGGALSSITSVERPGLA